jgi:alpha-L-arabinofuranosidase
LLLLSLNRQRYRLIGRNDYSLEMPIGVFMNSRLLTIFLCIAVITLSYGALANAQSNVLVSVDTSRPGIPFPATFYGLMTEEINHAYDGGLYAELIQNRNFKMNTNEPAHWNLVEDNGGSGQIGLTKASPLSKALPVSLEITINRANATSRVGVANDGYWGVPIRPGATYRASFYAEGENDFSGQVTIDLESADGKTVFASESVPSLSGEWKQYHLNLRTNKNAPTLAGRFVIAANQPGTFRLSLVSLFPKTYHGHPNGNRIDLMQKMAAMDPSFLRMPGGNYLDPGHLIWKNTIGPLIDRPGGPGAWGYPVTQGLGLLEMFEWCEDLHMQPVLAVSDGRGWLQGNADVAPLVQDALDEIQYAMGSASTPWGARRASDGHPKPFAVHFVEIGNEDFFDPFSVYNARFAKFYDAIKAQYPDIQIISTRPNVTSRPPDIIDEHYYPSVADMESMAFKYDSYPRTGPKIFVGEWASQDRQTNWTEPANVAPTPTMNAALGDAAWMTGMERNSDIVEMESYAPLLVNVNPGARQWPQNLIGYDALSSFGSPSYFVQVMFASNHGDTEIPVSVKATETSAPPPDSGGVGLGTWNSQAEFRNATVTFPNNNATATNQGVALSGQPDGGNWSGPTNDLTQTGSDTPALYTDPQADWTDYTYDVQARKTGGAEGFLIMFHVRDSKDYLWWNVGGWRNTLTQIERSVDGSKQPIGTAAPMTVETGRWYDIKVVLSGTDVKCFLDGKLVTEVTDTRASPAPDIFASASINKKTNEVYVHVVNIADTSKEISFDLGKGATATGGANGEVLTGPLSAINSISDPNNIVPVAFKIAPGTPLTYTAPPDSVSVLRLPTR